MKVIKFIKNLIFYGLLLIFILIVSSIGYSTYKSQQPNLFGYKVYVVLSGSMTPNINKGDLVIVKDVSFNELSVGDVITFKSKKADNYVTHRISEINIKEEKIITKGDANNVEDSSPVYTENIQGKMVNKINGIGEYVIFIQKNILIIVPIVVIFLILISIFIKCLFTKKVTVDNN